MALPRLVDSRRVRRLLGLALAAKGLLGVLAPRLTMRAVARVLLREAYENPGDLEPRPAYVDLVRDGSLGLLVVGLLTLLRASGGPEADADADADETVPASDDGGASAGDASARSA